MSIIGTTGQAEPQARFLRCFPATIGRFDAPADRAVIDGLVRWVEARYAEDLAVKEIACVLGRTQVSVRVLLMRARRRLAERAALADEDTLRAGARGGEDIPSARSQGGVPCSVR